MNSINIDVEYALCLIIKIQGVPISFCSKGKTHEKNQQIFIDQHLSDVQNSFHHSWCIVAIDQVIYKFVDATNSSTNYFLSLQKLMGTPCIIQYPISIYYQYFLVLPILTGSVGNAYFDDDIFLIVLFPFLLYKLMSS